MAKLSGARIIVNGIVALSLALLVRRAASGVAAEAVYGAFGLGGAFMVTLGVSMLMAAR